MSVSRWMIHVTGDSFKVLVGGSSTVLHASELFDIISDLASNYCCFPHCGFFNICMLLICLQRITHGLRPFVHFHRSPTLMKNVSSNLDLGTIRPSGSRQRLEELEPLEPLSSSCLQTSVPGGPESADGSQIQESNATSSRRKANFSPAWVRQRDPPHANSKRLRFPSRWRSLLEQRTKSVCLTFFFFVYICIWSKTHKNRHNPNGVHYVSYIHTYDKWFCLKKHSTWKKKYNVTRVVFPLMVIFFYFRN